jgi:hypothetical protein
MDVTTFLEPRIDLERISSLLDGLGHEGRYHTVRTWNKRQHRELFEAAKGFRPIDLDFLVPSGAGVLTEVIHDGHNTLPLFTHFQKRFVRLEGGDFSVAGYNHQAMATFTGPGYFGVGEGTGDHEGELVLDYSRLPNQKPASWPEVRANRGGLHGIVHGGLIDYLRAISTHVCLGAVYRDGQHQAVWFALVRRDPN